MKLFKLSFLWFIYIHIPLYTLVEGTKIEINIINKGGFFLGRGLSYAFLGQEPAWVGTYSGCLKMLCKWSQRKVIVLCIVDDFHLFK